MTGGTSWIVWAILAVAILFPLIWFIATYNRFVSLRQHIRESWSDIDTELKRRYELVPNLVNTVKGYMEYEQGTLQSLTEARARAMNQNGTAAQQGVEESGLQLAMGKVFALAEGYPQLKANEQFLSLQRELANTEDRIAAARRFFNGNVRDFNQLCEMFPSRLLAGMFGFKQETSFELSSDAEKVVPRVAL